VKINRLGDDVSQNLLELLLDWETIVDGVLTDGWDFLVVQLVVQLVDELITLSLELTVDGWSVYLTTSDNWGIDGIEDRLTSLTGDEWKVTGDSWDVTGDEWNVTGDGLVDLWGEVLLLDKVLEELLADELTLNNGVNSLELSALNWELLDWGNELFDWNDLLANLNINDLGLLNNLTFTGDWLNDDLLGGGENLDVSLDLSDISNNLLLVEEQVLVELLQKEFVVNSLGGWVVLSSNSWESITARDHILLLLSVNVWENILVPNNEVIISLTSEDVLLTIHILSIDGLLLLLVWESVFIGEELNKRVDVLVEVDGVQEVLTEGRDLPEFLEVDGSDVPLEDWVLDVLTEKRDGQVLTEELCVVDLFEGEDTINIVDSTELLLSIDEELLLLNWQDTVNDISSNGPFYREALAQLLLQQKVIDNWTGQQGPFLGQAKGVQIQAASGYGCDECDKDEGFHDEFVN